MFHLHLYFQPSLGLAKAFRSFIPFACCMALAIGTSAQPTDLPWQLDPGCQSIITNGIVAITCGTTVEVPANERYTFGMMNINGALPASGRIDVSAQVQAYHHPSWLIDSIGNVFGITMDDCGNTYVAASSNYSSYFFQQESVLRYGDIGGGASDVKAAGTVYKIDKLTGQASVFAVLPQQLASFTNVTCEGLDNLDRVTGPGLGNIVFSRLTRQYYVTDFEDGRIYRLDGNGNILDSYDPLGYDAGTPGTPDSLSEIAYGLDVTPDGSALFFGTTGYGGPFPLGPPAQLLSIPLNADGSFVGTINNASMPTGATWNNYVGNEVLHYEASYGVFGDANCYLSDIEFTPSGNLLVGGRIGCGGSVHTSYNHGGAAFLLSQNAGIYNNLVSTIFTGYPSSIGGSSESYGGVSVFNTPGGADQFVISSADMLMEEGPHGFCIVEEGVFGATGAPASPAGAVSYGTVSNTMLDPKGVGGDVKVFVECNCLACPTGVMASASATEVCSGTSVDLSFVLIGSDNATATWTDLDGNAVDPNDLVLSNGDCAPAQLTYIVTAVCQEDTSIVLTDSVTVAVYATDITDFINTVQEPCNVAVAIAQECADYLTLVGEIPPINPGDSGTVVVNIVSNDSLQCANLSIELNYNCPVCIISNLTAEVQECQDSSFMVLIDMDMELASDSFVVTDQHGNILGTFGYADLPVLVGPLLGDSVTFYDITVEDALSAFCSSSVTVGPKDCLPKCGFFEMPNVFSPNGDDVNDKFTAVSPSEFQVLDFKIYDRWGELVHDSVEPWDGKYKGKHLPPDVYIYIIIVDTFCGIEKKKGDVTLLR